MRRTGTGFWLLVSCLLLPWLCAAVAGCGVERDDVQTHDFPSTGLFTPGSRLGASDPTDTPEEVNLGDRCVEPFPDEPDGGVGGTPGQLTVEYTTMAYGGLYSPKNCTAVWIETADEGRYVATIELAVLTRFSGLLYWQQRACTEFLGPDVVTSATLKMHRAHTAVWNGLDFNGDPVPDGTYKVMIEVTESDKSPYGFMSEFEFQKGPQPAMLQPSINAGDPLASVQLTWVPGEGDAP